MGAHLTVEQATVEVTVDDGTLPGIETAIAAVTNPSRGELGIFGARSAGRSSNPQPLVRGPRRSLRITGTFAVP